ncbi:hypothetical protein D3C71_1744210 [compost metagenome]
MRREVERFEVVPVVFDFRAFGHFIPKPAEDLGNALQGTGDRMQASAIGAASRQGDVDGFGAQARVQGSVFQHRLALAQRAGERITGTVDGFAGGLALVGGQATELLELGGDAAVLAEQGNAQGFQRIGAAGSGHVGQCLGGQGLDVTHG